MSLLNRGVRMAFVDPDRAKPQNRCRVPGSDAEAGAVIIDLGPF